MSAEFVPKVNFTPNFLAVPRVRPISAEEVPGWFEWGFSEGEFREGAMPRGLRVFVEFAPPAEYLKLKVFRQLVGTNGWLRVVLLRVVRQPQISYVLGSAFDSFGVSVPIEALKGCFAFARPAIPLDKVEARDSERLDCELTQEFQYAMAEWRSRRKLHLKARHDELDREWLARIADYEDRLNALREEIRSAECIAVDGTGTRLADLVRERKECRQALVEAEETEADLRRSLIREEANERWSASVLFTLSWSVSSPTTAVKTKS